MCFTSILYANKSFFCFVTQSSTKLLAFFGIKLFFAKRDSFTKSITSISKKLSIIIGSKFGIAFVIFFFYYGNAQMINHAPLSTKKKNYETIFFTGFCANYCVFFI